MARRLGDANAGRDHHGSAVAPEPSPVRIPGDEEWRGVVAQVDAVEFTIDGQGLAKLPRPVGEGETCGGFSIASHHVQAHFGFDGADEDRFRAACRPANDVDTIMESVNELHVGVSRRAVHEAVAGRLTSKGVRGGVLLMVGLDLDDSSAAWTVGRVAHQPMAEQTRRYHLRRRNEKGPWQWKEIWHQILPILTIILLQLLIFIQTSPGLGLGKNGSNCIPQYFKSASRPRAAIRHW